MNVSRPDFLSFLGSGATAFAAADAAPSRLLLRGGNVVTLDPAVGDFPKADVFIENGKIVEIKPNLNPSGAMVIDAADTIVMPGFVDTHRHMWEGLMRGLFPDLSLDGYFKYVFYGIGPSFRPEDVYVANLMSALGAINAGITTILDFSHIQNTPQHADAAIQGLRESGMRAIFGYGYPTNGSPQWWTDKKESKYPEDIFRIQRQYFSSTDQLLTLCLAAQGPGTCPDDVTMNNWNTARKAGVRISVHAGSSGKRGFYEPFGKVAGFFGPDTTYIHCNSFSELEWKLVADSGGTVSLSPGSEMPMGHGLTATQAALDHGIKPSLSVDVETTEPSDFFTTIRLTLYLQRLMINLRALQKEQHLPRWISARDVLAFATIEGARACGLEHKTGTLTPGKEADVILLRTDRINVIPLNDAVGAVAELMDTSNVDTVIVRGRILKRNGRLVGVDFNRLRRMVSAARDYVLASADARTGGLKPPPV